MIRCRWWWLAALVVATAGSAEAASVVLPRPGQIGFSVQGMYGTLFKGGEYGDLFGAGGGFSFRARLRARYERGIGLSFERHGFHVRDEVDTLYAPVTLTLQTATLDVYQMFGTRTRTVKMLSASIGLSQGSQKLNDGEYKVGGVGAGESLVIGLGAGLERFVWQSMAVDLSTRYFVHFHHSKANHDLQFYGGVVIYVAS